MKIQQIEKSGKMRWRVNFHVGGKQHRRYFKTEKEASVFAAKIGRQIRSGAGFWVGLSPVKQHDIVAAAALAERAGIKLVEAVEHYVREHPEKPQEIELSTAVSRCVAAKVNQGLRPESFIKYKRTLERFAGAFQGVSVASVSSADIDHYLNSQGWAPATRKTVRTDLQTLFNWLVSQGALSANPVDKVDTPILDPRPPCILTVDQARALMVAARETDPAMSAFFALALFAGIRPKEVLRLTPDNLQLDRGFVEVPAVRAKTRQRRIVRLEPNAVAWCRVGAELPPQNWRKRFDRVRIVAGVYESWGHDIMRHSYGSYHLAMFEAADKTATLMGHRDTTMLFSHYRELVTPENAKAFWSIMPS